eukprot:3550850-Rhodomonas_salina.1
MAQPARSRLAAAHSFSAQHPPHTHPQHPQLSTSTSTHSTPSPRPQRQNGFWHRTRRGVSASGIGRRASCLAFDFSAHQHLASEFSQHRPRVSGFSTNKTSTSCSWNARHKGRYPTMAASCVDPFPLPSDDVTVTCAPQSFRLCFEPECPHFSEALSGVFDPPQVKQVSSGLVAPV